MAFYLIMAVLVFGLLAFIMGRTKAANMLRSGKTLHSRPLYHGYQLAIISTVPAIILIALWMAFSGSVEDKIILGQFSEQFSQLTLPQVQSTLRDAKALAFGGIVGFENDLNRAAAEVYRSLDNTSNIILTVLVVILALSGFFIGYRKISPTYRARHFVEKSILSLLILCSVAAILTTIGIVFSLLFESIRFFGKVSMFDFLFGYHWSPQSAFEGASGESLSQDNSRIFGAIPLFTGTFLITAIAILVAAPLGLMSAIYLTEYASSRFRGYVKPLLEILAGIPTVVYGFFAALTVAPAIRGWGESFGLSVSSESALAAGLVMGIMIIPFVLSLSDDVINSVPQSLRDGSYAMGATKSETIRKVIMPAALPGVVSALLLAISRAVGETMIVVMAAGLAANLTLNPLEAVTTVTVQIVTLLVGDQEFDSAKTLAAFALGLVLFVITLSLNIIALKVVQKYRQQYD